MTRYIVMDRSAGMPSSSWGRYRRIAVVETDLLLGEPRMISKRARGVIRIVRIWDRLNANGKNTAYTRALAEANKLIEEMTASS